MGFGGCGHKIRIDGTIVGLQAQHWDWYQNCRAIGTTLGLVQAQKLFFNSVECRHKSRAVGTTLDWASQ
jgi:hypothetical protein